MRWRVIQGLNSPGTHSGCAKYENMVQYGTSSLGLVSSPDLSTLTPSGHHFCFWFFIPYSLWITQNIYMHYIYIYVYLYVYLYIFIYICIYVCVCCCRFKLGLLRYNWEATWVKGWRWGLIVQCGFTKVSKPSLGASYQPNSPYFLFLFLYFL